MFVFSNKSINICFTDKLHSIYPENFRQKKYSSKNLIKTEPLACLASKICSEAMLFLYQQHGDQGFAVSSIKQAKNIKPFIAKGDYIVTSAKNLAIGVVTADCVPLILFEPYKNVLAVVHAGWRGAAMGICQKALKTMAEEFGCSSFKNVSAFFGPSARSCCYEIKKDVLDKIMKFSFGKKTIKRRDNLYFFDNPLFISYQLQQMGINSIDFSYCVCTICSKNFCSHRRGDKKRNISIACLTT